jgi:ribonuclease PH
VPRLDGRANNEPRRTKITVGYQEFAEGSSLIEMGKTRVLCAVSAESRVPSFLRGSNRGWLTAEYSMLPRSTLTRTQRESVQGRQGGRTLEIQRLIGRSLRAVTDLTLLPDRTLVVDCDVLQADGGTRTAAITGAYVALYQAFLNLIRRGVINAMPLRCAVAAISVGLVEGELLLDLCYEEDFQASVDFNVVMTDQGELVELQGTAEASPFSRSTLTQILDINQQGVDYLFKVQQEVVAQLR